MKRGVALLMLFAFLLPSAAFAAETKFPVKPIQLVVPYAPGGGSDITARIYAEALKEYLPEPVIVSNLTGGNGMNGMGTVAQARQDGYTILWEHPGCLIGVPKLVKAKFGWTDFDIVGCPAIGDTALFVKADSPYKTVDDLIKDVKARPNKVKWALGLNGATHFIYLTVREQIGDDFNASLVPIGGDKPKIVAMLSGSIDVSTAGYAAVIPYVNSGDLRVLAVINKERSPYAPDVPTLRELGVNAAYDFMYTAHVPKGTPEDVQKILAEAFKKASEDPKVKEALAIQFVAPVFLDKEAATARWADEAKALINVIEKNKMIK